MHHNMNIGVFSVDKTCFLRPGHIILYHIKRKITLSLNFTLLAIHSYILVTMQRIQASVLSINWSAPFDKPGHQEFKTACMM